MGIDFWNDFRGGFGAMLLSGRFFRAVLLATKNTRSTKNCESILEIGVPSAMQPWNSAVLLLPLCLFVADQIFQSVVRGIG
jgi:hypothetical protein